MAHKFKQVIYAGQKLVDESGGGGGAISIVDTPDEHGGTIREITAVDIEEALEVGSATPSETAQTITPSAGKLGFSKVNVGAVSSNYVGSGVARKTSSDLSASGATVTAPAGYYENDATKTLDSQAAQTIHPSTSDQTIASGKYLTGAQTIKAVTTNITADKIVSGFTAEIGDADDSDCVASVTGTASGGGLEEKAVNFYDYDGELLYAYTAQEFLALNAFPANPTHEGLTAQGWNWSLAGAKTYVTKYGYLQIGQTYEPTDGAAHVHIQIDDMKFADFTIKCPVGWVEWGDGSPRETVSSAANKTHSYAATGNYIIRLYCSAESWNLDMPGDPLKGLIREINLPKNQNQATANQFMDVFNLERFTIPNGGLLTNSSLNFLRNAIKLKAMIFPLSFTEFNTGVDTHALKAICFNEGLSGTLHLTCGYGSPAKAITIPDGVTTVTSYGSYNKFEQVETFIFPDSVTSIQNMDTGYNLRNLRYPSPSSTASIVGFSEMLYLKDIVVPDGIDTVLGFNRLRNCTKITIGEDVTTLAGGVGQNFMDTMLVAEIHMKPTTPPTRSTYNFRNKPSNCTIYVPYSADHSVLAAYQSATNWSNDAALMVEEQP